MRIFRKPLDITSADFWQHEIKTRSSSSHNTAKIFIASVILLFMLLSLFTEFTAPRGGQVGPFFLTDDLARVLIFLGTALNSIIGVSVVFFYDSLIKRKQNYEKYIYAALSIINELQKNKLLNSEVSEQMRSITNSSLELSAPGKSNAEKALLETSQRLARVAGRSKT